MQRWVSALVGLAVLALVVWVTARNFQSPKAIGHDPMPPALAVDAGTPAAAVSTDAGAAPSLAIDASEPLSLSDLLNQPLTARLDGGAGNVLFDGSLVPPLPQSTPRQVRFGVVLVSYSGAQPGATGRTAARSKEDAKALALKLFATAEQDFHAAVQQGDAGSTDDIGRVKLGILEPAPEYILFTQPVNGVGGPVDTPRGFWIVKRLE